jgi:glycosyltransferase involved in cell wall biosynthesis
VLVAPGVHDRGGMDRANLAVARYLAERGTEVHLVAHEVDAWLAGLPGVATHQVPRPLGSFLVGERYLDRRGRAVAREVIRRWPGARVLVNGGNCRWSDINWVHSVHHAWPCADAGAPAWFRAKNRVMKGAARAMERAVIPRARVVFANSELTRRHLIEHLGVDPARVRVVYLGADAAWGPPGAEEREAARVRLGRPGGRPLVVFVGALGHDHNKGFDTLLAAWKSLCARTDWDVDLLAAGGGRGVERWRAEVAAAGLRGRVGLLGFTERVPELLAAADLLVSPVRYEAYGLNVQEAICRGVPALVSGGAGIAERYPPELRSMILPDPRDARDLEARLLAWRRDMGLWRDRFRPLAERLLAHTWHAMAEAIVTGAGE